MSQLPSEIRRRALKDMDFARKSVDEAFDHGVVVSIRTQARQDDLDSIVCLRCWDPVRNEAKDPTCPMCQGSGWIDPHSMTGYRMRTISRAHIPEIQEQYTQTSTGQDNQVNQTIWVNYTPRELRDGDLIALIEPDDIDEPTSVKVILRKYEVTNAQQPALNPGFHPEGGPMILAQQVGVNMIRPHQPEDRVDMTQTYSAWQVKNLDPFRFSFDDVTAMSL